MQNQSVKKRVFTRARACLLIVIMAGVTAVSFAGFDGRNAREGYRYEGQRLSEGEWVRMRDAIVEIRAMAESDESPRTQRTLNQIAECLERMLGRPNRASRLCAEVAATHRVKGVCQSENPRMCTWTGDRINIAQHCISGLEPELSLLIAVLVHEAIHALQWPDPDKPGQADTTAQREWAAYTWESYMLRRRLDENDSLTKAQRERIEERIRFTEWMRDTMCDRSLTNEARARRVDECQPRLPRVSVAPDAGTDGYVPRGPGAPSGIRVIQDESVAYEFDVPLNRVRGMALGPGVSGGDALYVCGETGPEAGAIYVYTDNTGDGLVDQDTEQHVPANGVINPVSLAVVDGLSLFVLDKRNSAVHFVPDAQFGTGLDVSSPFFTDVFLLDPMYFLRPLEAPGPLGCVLSPFSPAFDEFAPEVVELELRLLDTTFDLVADTVTSLVWAENLRDPIPTLTRTPQSGDISVFLMAGASASIGVFETDADASFLGSQIGSALSNPESLTFELALNRALIEGEHIVAVDLSNGNLMDGQGTEVQAVGPQIFEIDDASYFPGETAMVTGRNFPPGSQAFISGLPVPTMVGARGIGSLAIEVPELINMPSNFFVLEIDDGQGNRSNIAGLEIIIDCNENGIDDFDDFVSGLLTDADRNGVADECEGLLCSGDCDQDGDVDFNDLVTMLFDFGTPGTNIACDPDDSGSVDFNDLVTALFLFGPCD